jgi:putative hydrolase of the HAD superfamily
MRIEAVLFDADGVIQRPAGKRRSKLGEVLGSSRNVDEFLTDIFAVELTALEGQSDFTKVLSNLLSEWKCPGTLGDFLDAWTMIEVAPEIADTVRTLKRVGVACYLATNQEPYRARYMSEALGYGDLFDREFYSCRIGVKKPDGAYFRTILKVIGVPPRRVLFLDDLQVNVDSAREVGLYAAVFTLEAGPEALHRILGEFGIHVAPGNSGKTGRSR